MEKPQPRRTAQAGKIRQFAEKARAELKRRGFSDMDIDIKLILRRQSAKRALRALKAKNSVKT